LPQDSPVCSGATSVPQAPASPTVAGDEALEQLKVGGQYQSLDAAIRAALYRVESDPDGDGFYANNYAQHFAIRYTEGAALLTIKQPVKEKEHKRLTEPEPRQEVSLRFAGAGYGQRIRPVTGNATVNGTLNVLGAFTLGGTFDNAGGSATFMGNAAQMVPALTYNNLTINNSAGVTLGGPVTVNGLLTLMSGNLSTGANTLTLAGSGTVSRTSGYVIGNLKKVVGSTGSLSFPVGTANGYSPVIANFTSGTGRLICGEEIC
jgi:hypothetical protein